MPQITGVKTSETHRSLTAGTNTGGREVMIICLRSCITI
jgi:hypothetical protein